MKWFGPGFALVSGGFAVPFLTVLRVIEVDIPVLLLAYAASLAGLCLGLIGATRRRV